MVNQKTHCTNAPDEIDNSEIETMRREGVSSNKIKNGGEK
jgi:hypothetical protein